MNSDTSLGPASEFDVTKIKGESVIKTSTLVASEVPFTLLIDEKEIATLLCTPSHLKELAYGFLFTSGIIHSHKEVTGFVLDPSQWIGYLELSHKPETDILSKRMYTSGCGKGIVYASAIELFSRTPLDNSLITGKMDIYKGMHFLLQYSQLYKKTGGVHTVALMNSKNSEKIVIDDIGRHNALDKVIGKALLSEIPFSECLVFCTGRISSEMLHKVKRSEIPVVISRGAPTHQAVLRARSMGITLIGFVRSKEFTIFSHPERIVGE